MVSMASSEANAVLAGLLAVTAQGMDDQALEVLKAAKSTEELLAGKVEALAGARTEYERKQKEVRSLPAHALNDLALPMQGVHFWCLRQSMHCACLFCSLKHYDLLLLGILMQPWPQPQTLPLGDSQ